ncbi:hypothetical protein GUJ93_ZPchr0011g27172 [Zizania palustris]|uniref:Uncharacterized protein n=1 Tax=Zizania palustris TaxID=103762 RepID=A0A8J6BN69_ZIZPA|nr:hypothetical protein GUJ93_ZPchr0011g27172 [Zizania palustris]
MTSRLPLKTSSSSSRAVGEICMPSSTTPNCSLICAVREVALASATLLTSPIEPSPPDLALPRLPVPPSGWFEPPPTRADASQPRLSSLPMARRWVRVILVRAMMLGSATGLRPQGKIPFSAVVHPWGWIPLISGGCKWEPIGVEGFQSHDLIFKHLDWLQHPFNGI